MNRFVMAAVVIENILYFSDRYSNGLYRLNLDNNECTFIDFFGDEEDRDRLYFQAYTWEKNIYFIPGYAENIACFDTIKKEITYIKLPQEGIVIHGVDGIFAEKFCCQRKENILWMMPVGYNLFLKLDLSNGELSKIELPDSLVFKEGIFNWRTNSLYGEELIFQPWAGNIRVHYNLISGRFKLEDYNEGIRTYRSYFKIGNYEIFVPWNLKSGLLVKNVVNKKKEVFLLDERVKNITCCVIFQNGNQLFLMPELGSIMIIITIPDFCVEYIDLNKKFNKNYVSWELSDMAGNAEKCFALSSTTSEILQIDLCSNEIKLIEIKQDVFELKRIRFIKCAKHFGRRIFQVNLKRFLDEQDGLEQLMVQAYVCSTITQEEKIGYGDLIYQKMKY